VSASPSDIEREVKLQAWAGFELPDLTGVVEGLVAVTAPDQHLEATYYDTTDLRLARAGISMRFRTGEGVQRAGRSAKAAGRWTVKLPDEGAGPGLARREISVDAAGRTIPEELSSLVRAHVRSAPLAPVATLSTHRRRVELRDGARRVLVEIADDQVSVLENRRVAVRFREIEAELRGDAPVDVLEPVTARLEAAGARSGEQTSKVVRALGPRSLDPPDVVVAALGRDANLADVVGAAVASGYTRLLRHDPGVRIGGHDEDVHQARVAARRLRSDLRTFRGVLDPDANAALREELQWLGAELGHVRDGDVLADRLGTQAIELAGADLRAATGLLKRLESERAAARQTMLAALDSDRYVRLVDALADAAVRPRVTLAADEPAVDALRNVVRGPWKHLRQAVDALADEPEDEALHDIRIRAKRARYAAEAAAPVLGKPALRFAKAVANVQGVLGELQDAVVAEEWLRGAGVKGPARQALLAGELIGVQRVAMAEARRSWRAAWDELSDKKLRSWLIQGG